MGTKTNAIEVSGIKKYFGDIKALDGVDLTVHEGSIFGLLGPNGAGKTTLVNIMTTLLSADEGQSLIGGYCSHKEPRAVREIIGLAGQSATVDEVMTGRENIEMVGRLYHIDKETVSKRADDILHRLGLADAADRQAKTYSGGMRRRLDLGASLVAEPKILFLDEPTTGLDPRTRLELWEIIRELNKNGTTILLTTQYLEEADELADYIALIDHGKVISEGTADQLKDKLGDDVVEIILKDPEQSTDALKVVRDVAKKRPVLEENGKKINVPVVEGAASLMRIVRSLDDANIGLAGVSLHRPTLDDVFLKLTADRPKRGKK